MCAFLKIRSAFLSVLLVRLVAFGDRYWCPPIYGNYLNIIRYSGYLGGPCIDPKPQTIRRWYAWGGGKEGCLVISCSSFFIPTS